MTDNDLTKRIVNGLIRKGIDEKIPTNFMEPNVDRILLFAVTDKLRILQETFRIEEFTMPEVRQDEQDPTVIVCKFKYVPTRDFDWNKPIEWITLEFKVSSLGTSERI